MRATVIVTFPCCKSVYLNVVVALSGYLSEYFTVIEAFPGFISVCILL